MTYSEARRDLESANDETGFDSVDSDAFEGEILVEARVSTGSLVGNGESRNDFGFLLVRFQELFDLLHS